MLSPRRRREKILEQMRRRRPTCSPFDGKGTLLYGLRSLRERICNDRYPCCSLVTLYAKMGLHRYNLLKGKNYQFVWVKKYHYRLTLVPSSYYITLEAMDPSTSLLQTFHTRIDEHLINRFVLTCNFARIPGESIKYRAGLYQGGLCSRPGNIPDSSTENPFENGKRFYVLNKLEVQDNDWIRLYLELAVAKCRITTENPDVSNLKIMDVAIETHDLNEGLNAKNATVYISYKDFCEKRVGKDVDRIAVVRRTFSKRSGCFSLMGQHHSSEIIPKKGANQGEDNSCEAGAGEDAGRIRSSFNEHARCLNRKGQDLSTEKKCKYQRVIRHLGVHKPHKAYRNHGVGLALVCTRQDLLENVD